MVAKGFKKKYFTLAAITATVSMIQLHAENSRINSLQTIVVTADKTQEPLSETTEDIKVVSSEEIEEMGIENLKELLNYIPGALVTSNGGVGKSSSLYLRGLSNDKVLILIDGVRYYDPSNFNGPSIEHLFLNDIDRVEIIKGAQSGVWGADGSSGVINIITKPATKGAKASLFYQRGSFKTNDFKARISQSSENSFYQASFSFFNTNGVSAITPYGENPKNYERDGYLNTNLYLKGGYKSENALFEMGTNKIYGYNKADGYDPATFQPDPNSRNDDTFKYSSVFINSRYSLSSHKLSLHLDKTRTKRRFLEASWGVNRYEGRTKNIELKDDFSLYGVKFLIGADYQQFKTLYREIGGKENEVSYDSRGVFAVSKKRFNNLLVNLNLRYDNYRNFDDQTTGKVGFKYFFKNASFFTNYSTAYNVPNQMKILNPWGKSNPNLQPEKIDSYDIGVEYFGFKTVFFEQRVKDLIGWYDPDINSWGDEYYKNFSGKSRFKGVEISLEKAIGENFIINIGYTYINAKDSDGKDLPRRAKNRYSYSLTYYPSKDDTINVNGYYLGERFDDSRKTRQTGKYGVTNLTLSHRFAKNFTGYFGVKNLFDKRYQEVYGYSSMPRSFYAGIKGEF